MSRRAIPAVYVAQTYTTVGSTEQLTAAANTKGAIIGHCGAKITSGGAIATAGIKRTDGTLIFGVSSNNSTGSYGNSPDELFLPPGIGFYTFAQGNVADAAIDVGYTLLT